MSHPFAYLGIETSSTILQVAVLTDSGPVVEVSGSAALSHNEEISRLVSSALKSADRAANELSALVISSGPGSFTGLRIGYSFAKGLSLALGLRIYPVCSLRAAAFEFHNRAQIIASVKDARRNEVYISVLSSENEGPVEVFSPRIVPVQEVSDFVAEACQVRSVAPEKALIVSSDPEMIKGDVNFSIAKASHTASGLLGIFKSSAEAIPEPGKNADLTELAELSPSYYRRVEAKTVKQRRLEKS